jgi:hypothetical protein
MDTIANIAAVVNLIGLGGFAWLIRGWFRSLKGTVETQAQTISTLKTVIDTMDLPKMLERFEAFKKITDRQKEAEVEEIERKFSEQQAAFVQSGEESKKGYEQDRIDFIDLILDLMPYVRKEIRYKVIASSNFSDEVKHTLQDTARKTLDLSWPMPALLEAIDSIDPNTKLGDVLGRLSRPTPPLPSPREEKK